MKKLLILIIMLISHFCSADSQEVTLFDNEGNPVAYIDTTDEDNSIYLWDGTPVCYLVTNGDNYSVYGFNGEHLGWFQKGTIIDHEGYIVGFQKEALDIYTKYEPYKSYKKYKPYKSYKKFAPYMPYVKSQFSKENFVLFLKRGRD